MARFCRARRLRAGLAIGILLSAAGAGVWWRWGRQAEEQPLPPVPSAAAEAGKKPSEEEALRRLVVGTWQDDYQGKRTMTLRDDGTGEMLVELSGLKASLFAPRLQFEMKWSLEGRRLKKQTIGGEPAAQVKIILQTMGDRVDEQILELTPGRLLLLDPDGKTRYDWRRAKGEPKDSGSP